MADQVQVRLVGDDKAFLKTLQKLRDRFKQLQSASNKAQKTVRQGAQKSKTQLNAQRNSVRLLTNAFTRLGRVGVASQKIMQTQIRRTSSLLRKQLALLKRARVIPQGTGGRGPLAPTARQARPTRTPASDRPQFFGVPPAQTRPAPVGTPIRNVNAQGNLTQAALAKESAAVQRVAAQREAAAQRAVAGERQKAASTRTSTGAIRKQSQPLTLLVAKFALMAFAVQTLANILNSTFGQALRSIDEFQIAAIGVATAVTGITDATGEGIGEAFNQNLQAALETFEELELVAARFFATGQELQLAFNTFAQRGVVIRREELETLGKITDQIKLLTGGQNLQIQIQQEIRAILDGNIRTTTAFAKSLQSRGVDVRQLSKEVRATGSLKPFEPFLTGLDAAGPAIRRTLSSVLATFGSLTKILNRRIFQDTFDDIVAGFTKINNFIIDNLDLLTAMGKVIKDDVAGGFKDAIGFVDRVGGAIIKVASSDVGKLIAAIALINKALRLGPLGFIFAMAAAISILAKDGETFGRVISIAFSLVELAIQNSLPLLEKMISLVDRAIKGTALLASSLGGNEDAQQLLKLTIQARSAAGKIEGAAEAIADLREERAEALADPDGGITILRVEQIDKEIASFIKGRDRLLEVHTDLVQQIRDNPVNAAFDFAPTGEAPAQSLSERLKNAVKTIDENLKDATGSAETQIKSFSDQVKDIFTELAAATKVAGVKTGAEFTDTTKFRQIDEKQRDVERARQRQREDNALKASAAAEKNSEALKLAELKKAAAVRGTIGREVFKQENALREQARLNEIRRLEELRQLAQDRARFDIALLNERNRDQPRRIGVRPVRGESTKNQEETTLAIIVRRQKLEENIAKIDRDIANVKGESGRAEVDAAEKVLAATKETNAELEKRRQQLAAFGGETNAERIRRFGEEERRDIDQFNEGNTDPGERATFATQAAQITINKAIKPQIDAFTGAIDAAFQTLIDGMVEGAFEFRDLAQTLSKDFIKAGLDGVINQVKNTVTKGLTAIFKAAGDGSENAAAGAQRAAQGLTLAFGLLLAVLSRTGSKGEFQATGAGAGGVDQSGVQTRGLIGGDQNIAIAEINNGLQEALIPTNAILSAIEVNTRGLQGLSLGIDPDALAQAITAQVQGLFSQALLQTP